MVDAEPTGQMAVIVQDIMRNPESVRKSQKNSQVKEHGENERNRARHTSQKKSPMNVRVARAQDDVNGIA